MKIFNAKPLSGLYPLAYALLRFGSGAAMITHGYPKFMKLLEGGEIKFADPLGVGVMLSLILAVFAELFCAVLVALGLFTRAAVIPLIVTMAVAAFVVHGADPFGKKELALLYLLAYILIFAGGSGSFSVDRLRGKG